LTKKPELEGEGGAGGAFKEHLRQLRHSQRVDAPAAGWGKVRSELATQLLLDLRACIRWKGSLENNFTFRIRSLRKKKLQSMNELLSSPVYSRSKEAKYQKLNDFEVGN
jgi:hypothetical protein